MEVMFKLPQRWGLPSACPVIHDMGEQTRSLVTHEDIDAFELCEKHSWLVIRRGLVQAVAGVNRFCPSLSCTFTRGGEKSAALRIEGSFPTRACLPDIHKMDRPSHSPETSGAPPKPSRST